MPDVLPADSVGPVSPQSQIFERRLAACREDNIHGRHCFQANHAQRRPGGERLPHVLPGSNAGYRFRSSNWPARA